METVSLAGVIDTGTVSDGWVAYSGGGDTTTTISHQRATLFSMVPTSHPHCKIIMF